MTSWNEGREGKLMYNLNNVEGYTVKINGEGYTVKCPSNLAHLFSLCRFLWKMHYVALVRKVVCMK